MNGKLFVCVCAIVWGSSAAAAEITYELYEKLSYHILFDAWEEAGPNSRAHLWARQETWNERSIGDWFSVGSHFLGYEVAIEKDGKGSPMVCLRKPGSRDLRLPLNREAWLEMPVATFHLLEGLGQTAEGFEGSTIALGTKRLTIRRLTPGEATVQLEDAPEPLILPISPAAPARSALRWELREFKTEYDRRERQYWDRESQRDMELMLVELSLALLCSYLICYAFIAAGLLTLQKLDDVPRRRRIRPLLRPGTRS